MSNRISAFTYANLYEGVVSGLLASASYNEIAGNPAKIAELLDTADVITASAIDRYFIWVRSELGDLRSFG